MRGIEALNSPHDSVDPWIFRGVDSRREAKSRSGLAPIDDDDRNLNRLRGCLADGQEPSGTRSRSSLDVPDPNLDCDRFHGSSLRAKLGDLHLACGNGSDTMRLEFALSSHEKLARRNGLRHDEGNRHQPRRREAWETSRVE